MTTFAAPPRHRGASFLHRHRSDSTSRVNSRSESPKSTIFEGTDAVPQHRKVSVQRIVEVHDCLEQDSSRSSMSSTSSDPLKLDFKLISIPNAEVRTFQHFLRMWDPTVVPDPEFDHAVLACNNPQSFEADAMKHFFKRIALWNESGEVLEEMARKAKKEKKRREKDRKHLEQGEKKRMQREGIYVKEDDEEESKQSRTNKLFSFGREGESEETLRVYHNPLAEVTTREGIAQLLWTLMHDNKEPLTPELFNECTLAVKRKYGMAS